MADVTVAGALLTAFGSILAGGATGFLTARIKNRHDLAAWERSRATVLSDTSATILRDTVAAIATVGHAACWLTWKARFDPGSLTQKHLEDYDWAVHEQMPKMLGGQAAIATLCPDAAEVVMQAIDAITAEDFEIGRACIAHRHGDPRALADRHDTALQAYQRARTMCAGLGAQLVQGKVR